jgi:hypothetical protein
MRIVRYGNSTDFWLGNSPLLFFVPLTLTISEGCVHFSGFPLFEFRISIFEFACGPKAAPCGSSLLSVDRPAEKEKRRLVAGELR